MRLRNITSSIMHTSVLSLAIASSASAQCGSYCLADQNQDGVVDASDFTAWINNFNNNDPLADVNQNGVLDGGDYTAWVAQFNLGPNGDCCPGPIYMITPCAGGSPIFTKNDLSSCEGSYAEYNANEIGFVSIFPGELDSSQLTAVNLIGCVSDCGTPNDPDDDPDIDPGGVLESSMVLLLSSTCEPLINDCGEPASQLDTPDATFAVRLQRDGFSGMNPSKPKWIGSSNGRNITVVYRGDLTHLDSWKRWQITTSHLAYPQLSCSSTCNLLTTGHSNSPTHAPYDKPYIWDCYNPGNQPSVPWIHYSVIVWQLISDFNGQEQASHYGGFDCVPN